MNAWGDEPLLQLASALHKKSGDRAPPTERAPADGDLDSIATTDAEFVETDVGTVVFPPRPDMRRPLVDLLQQGPLSSQMLEDALAKQFSVTDQMRAALLQNNCPAWRNHVAWVLVDRAPGGPDPTRTFVMGGSGRSNGR